MRSDMSKVVTERPRNGGNLGFRQGYVRDFSWKRLREEGREEESPCRDIGRKRKYEDYKEFDDHISPLYRYLEKACGRPWNDVYSEICANLKLDSTTQRHIRDHVDDYVEKNVRYKDGKPVVCRWGMEISIESPDRYFAPNFWVDREGILRAGRARRRKYKPDYSEWTPPTDLTFPYVQKDGYWYQVDLRRAGPLEESYEHYVNGYIYSNKRQLSAAATEKLQRDIEALRARKLKEKRKPFRKGRG